MKIKLTKKIALFAMLVFLMGKSLAQVTVNIVLIPPYSPYFSDYLSYENKAVITIIKSSTLPNSIYLKGSIIGDNGVSMITKPGYKPGTPIDLPNVTTVINGSAIGDYFTWENTEITGTTPSSIIRNNGLPEGNYKVCVTPYDYSNDQPVGVESCTNFKIVQVEPPVILGPFCNSNVLPTPAQTVVFSWSPAPGAPPNVRYVMTMVELVNEDQNPNDALNAATTPPFFEEDEGSSTVNVYNLSDPKLTVGKSYAWRVQAYDPKNLTAFRNNGFSEACKFTYKPLPGPVTSAGQSIVISTPNCNAKTDTVYVSEETDAMWSWLWQAQIDDPKLIADNSKLNFGGRRPFKYTIKFTSTTVSTDPVKSKMPVFEVLAKSQNFTQTLKQVSDLKMLGNKYRITITALDSAGGKIADTTSCEFLIRKVNESKKGQVVISGKLNYKFTNGTQISPANNTLISLQINPKKVITKSDPDPIDYTRPYVTVTTNENGEFTASLGLSKADTGNQQLGVFIRSPYYSQFAQPLKVNLSYQKQDPATKKIVSYGQKDTLSLGALLTTVYSYDLKVVMGKGFPSFYVDSLTKNIYDKGVSIDTLSINPKSKVKAGITVKLYRKSKSKFIPYYESDNVVKGPADKEGRIAVAEGKTIISKNAKGEDETIVEFHDLIVNMSADDKYYIQAVIPPKHSDAYKSPYGLGDKAYDKGIMGLDKWKGPADFMGIYDNMEAAPSDPVYDEDQDLTAPEMEITFLKSQMVNGLTSYKKVVNYKLLSTIPPLSQIKGKLVYRWPSDPNVIRPLANARFKVVLTYMMGNQPLPKAVDKSGCTISMTKIEWNNSSNPGDKTYLDRNDEGLIVGTGETDDQGNFTIKVINHNQKGKLTANATITQTTVKDPACDKTKQKEQMPWEKKDWGVNEEYGANVMNNGWNNGWDNGASQHGILDFSNGASAQNGWGVGAGFSANGFGGKNAGFQNYGAGAGAAAAGAMDGLGKSVKGVGPADPNIYDIPEDEQKYEVTRGFYISLDYEWGKYYNGIDGPNNTNNFFVVDAFETKDLGTFTANVNEVKTVSAKKILFTVKSKLNKGKEVQNFGLTGAKCVVFRLPNTKTPHKPEGEGSSNHPSKKLLKPVFSNDYAINDNSGSSQDYYNGTFEWVLDATLDLGYDEKVGKSYVSFENKKLLRTNGKYFLQISPDPQNGGPSFDPIIIPFEEEDATVTLALSRIAGRLMDKSSKKGIGGKVTVVLTNGSVFHTKTIDKSGYWEMINFKFTSAGDFVAWNDGTKYFGYGESYGYKVSFFSGGPVDMEGRTWNHPLELEPKGKLKGTIVDEDGNPIEAYVIRDDSTVFENKVIFSMKKIGTGASANYVPVVLGGDFSIPVTSGSFHKIKIVPKDVGYFDTSILTFVGKDSLDLKKIKIYRRKHRIVFDLKFKDANGNPLPMPSTGYKKNNIRATINNDDEKSATNSNYAKEIQIPAFENVSSTKYSVLFEGVTENGFIPETVNITNKETRDPVHYEITIKRGLEINGKVTLDGAPVKNARVYIDMNSYAGAIGSGKAALNNLETRTDASGNYSLAGVPKMSGKTRIYATLDTSFTVNGDMKEVSISEGSTTVNLGLKKLGEGKITDIYGFPISIESINKMANGNYKVTGLVDITQGQTRFQWLDPNFKVRIVDAEFIMKGGVGVAVKASQSLDAVSALKMKYMERYNVNIKGSSNPFVNDELKLEKSETEGGVLAGFASIVDNSFDFPSSYLSFDKTGNFYLGLKKSGNKLETKITAIRSKKSLVLDQYNLSNKSGEALKFSFIGFSATAIPAESFIDIDGKIHLSVDVTGNSPSMKLSKVNFHVPDLVIDNNKVYQAKGSEPIVLDLQNWKLEIKDWKIDPTEGGLISKNCLIKTGVVDIPAKKFNLRNDFFVLEEFDLNKLTLGGGVLNLSEISPESDLVFDEHCGSDLGAHWRFVIGKNGNAPAAKITGMNPYINTAIPLDYIQLISFGNENILSMGDVSGIPNMFGNDKITFIPKQIVSGANTFNLTGEAKIAVPRFPVTSMSINFTGKPGALNANLEPLKIKFEAPGYVDFVGDNTKAPIIDASSGKFTILGTCEEPGKFNPVNCKLVFGGGQNGRIYLTPGDNIYLTSKSATGPKLTISSVLDSNGMWVTGADWNTFRFHGKYYDNTSTGVVAAPPTMYFQVFGEISASSKSISMNEIKTPFGDMEMTFDFANKRLYGLLVIKEGTKIGAWDVTGQVETTIDPNGFVVLGLGTINTGKLFVDGYGLFKVGFVLGGYPLTQEMITKACTYAVNPAASCWLQANKSNFKGFWFCGNNQIINEHYDFNAIIATAYLHADAVIEASLGVNFGGTPNFEMNIAAFGKVDAGMSAITGTYIEGHLAANAIAKIAYKNGLTFDAKGDFSCNYKICQTLPFVDDICYSDTKGCAINFGYNGGTYFSFSLDGPGKFQGCPVE